MRLVWHLAKHDVLATRRLAGAWLVLVLLGYVFISHGPISVLAGYRGDELVSFLFAFSRVAGVALLATVIAQRDPLDDPSAFWRTRPIPRVALWLGKMTAIVGLTALLPALLLSSILWSAGVAGVVALRYGADLAVDHVALASAALLIAVPARSIAQAIAGSFLATASLLLLAGLLDALPDPPPLWPTPSPDQLLTAGVVAAAAITATHYLTLRRRLAVSLSAALAVALVAAPSFAIDVPSTREGAGALPMPPGAVVTLGTDGVWRKASPGEEDEDRFSASVHVTSPASDTYFVPSQGDAVLSLPSGMVTVNRADVDTARAVSVPATPDIAPYANMRALLGVSTLMLPPAETVWAPGRLVLPVTRAVAREMEAGAARLTASIALEERRLDMLGHVPLAAAATANTRGGRLRIVGVQALPGDIVVDVSWLGDVPWNLTYVLVTGDGRRAAVGRTGGLPSTPDAPRATGRMSMGGWRLALTAVHARVAFALPAAGGQLKGGAWQGATLHVIETRSDVGRRRVAIEVDGVGRLP